MTDSQSNDTIQQIAKHYEEILKLVGEDPTREGLLKTPLRAAKALYRITSGYRSSADEVVGDALFTHEGSRIVTVKDIEFYSVCEHHILPFFGTVSIGYVPNGKIIGLSKLARLVDCFARRLQVQERFTAQLCSEVKRVTGAAGVIAICNAQHLCMKMRGVEKQQSSTATIEYNGCFAQDSALRSEFLNSL